VSPSPTSSVGPPPPVEEPVAVPQPVVRVGSFRTIAHQTTGGVRVGTTPSGEAVVFLEDLMTDNGPDVRVLLSPQPADGDASQLPLDALELGPMKGNIGDQRYDVPPGTDLSRYQSVVLWCERFSVGFAVAGLAPDPSVAPAS
jgi:hypothetical protein